MNCAKRVVTVLFLFGMTFTSFIPIEARQNLKVAGVDNGCLIADGSVGATAPLPRLSLGSCDEDYTLDVEFDYYYQYESEAYGLRIGDSSGDIGCMSYDGDWLAADVCLETPNFNQLWRLTMDWSGTSATTEIGNGKLGNHFDSLCVQYIPDAETGENLKMIDCNVVTTIFLLVDAPLVDAPFDCSADYNATKPIDNFQLQTVGVLAPDENQTEVPSPVSVYLNDDGMTVQLYYEGHPDHATNSTIIDVTLYASQAGGNSAEEYCEAFNVGEEYMAYANTNPTSWYDNPPTITFYEDGSGGFALCCGKNECGEGCSWCSSDLAITMLGPCEDNIDGYKSLLGRGYESACIIPPDALQTATSSADTPPPCGGNGEALPTALYDVNFAPYGAETYNGFYKQLDASECFPQTTNGVVARAEIIMTENPFDSDLANYIYNASVGTNDGQLEFCARIAYSIGDELVSYLDSNLVLDVSLSADINFTQVVNISSTQTANTVNQDVSSAIDVTSFLCGDPNENDGTPYAEDYSLGQSFRVCVDVKAADRDKFGLTNFKDVKCSTASDETTIVSLVNDVATAASILTTLFDNEATVGAKSVASGTPSTQIEASGRAISFSTVVTNAYLTGDADTLTCAGSVDVETVDESWCTGSSTSVEEFCGCYKNAAFATGVYSDAPNWNYYEQEGGESMCCDSFCGDNCEQCQTYSPNPNSRFCTGDDIGDFDDFIDNSVCIVPAEALSRRQLVSFTVPNPMASSSASSRRRMDEETGAAVTGATADFGAIIKLSSSSSSSSSGPFLLLLWATTTTLLLLSAGWSL